MLGAIAGDVIGSVYEARPIKTPHFQPLFHPRSRPTDDSVLTVALADSLLSRADYGDKLREYHRLYPGAGYGASFSQWALSGSREPYNSWGNGSAMRVSPAGFAAGSLGEALGLARHSAEWTHKHPEGIKGAQATAAAIFLFREGKSKEEVRDYIEATFDYDLHRTLDEIRPHYEFDVSCQGTVPQAILSVLESSDFENAVRLAVSLGGDSDTLACIAGGIAQALYGGVPDAIRDETLARLDDHLRGVVDRFIRRYP